MSIESLQNEKIKNLTKILTDNRFRKRNNIFTVEGKKENEKALAFGYESIEYFLSEDLYQEDFPKGKINLISEKIYEKLAYRGTTEGIIGVYKVKEQKLLDFKPATYSSIIILESVEKPGNLGAIIRSCEAFGIDAIIVTDPKIDFYNPNVIRSSVGCLFGMKIFQASNLETLDFIENNEFTLFTTYMDEDSVEIQTLDLKNKTAILFGTEHSGISPFWLNKGRNILIPMCGTIDSLNLSNAVAISCYEILRQKR